MKMNVLKSGLLGILWMVYSLPILAGPVDPPGEDDPIYEDPTPIDNWMLLLLMGAVAVGIYFLVKYRRKSMA